jgi:hypothetical protein
MDGSRGAVGAAAWAIDEARCHGVELVPADVWHIPRLAYSAPGFVPPSDEEMEIRGRPSIEEDIGQLAATAGVKVRFEVHKGAQRTFGP